MCNSNVASNDILGTACNLPGKARDILDEAHAILSETRNIPNEAHDLLDEAWSDSLQGLTFEAEHAVRNLGLAPSSFG
jgi:hypothetical protein